MPGSDAILVLGMHRSGTSAVTGVLGLLGVFLGEDMVDSELEFNQKGYWENRTANELNQKFLESAGSDWFDVKPLPATWMHQSNALKLREQVEELLTQNFSKHPLWAIKDPRICRLLPVWLDSLANCGFNVKGLTILRHPYEVFRSLEQRNHIGESYSALLWLRYVLDCERDSTAIRRNYILYSDLLSDWRGTMTEVQEALGISLDLSDKRAAVVDEFLDSRLRHHVVESDIEPDQFMNLAQTVYNSIATGDFEYLDTARLQYENMVQETRPWLLQTERLLADQAVNRLFKARAEVFQEHHAAQKHQLSALQSSVSWRITRPLRQLKRLFKS